MSKTKDIDVNMDVHVSIKLHVTIPLLAYVDNPILVDDLDSLQTDLLALQTSVQTYVRLCSLHTTATSADCLDVLWITVSSTNTDIGTLHTYTYIVQSHSAAGVRTCSP